MKEGVFSMLFVWYLIFWILYRFGGNMLYVYSFKQAVGQQDFIYSGREIKKAIVDVLGD